MRLRQERTGGLAGGRALAQTGKGRRTGRRSREKNRHGRGWPDGFRPLARPHHPVMIAQSLNGEVRFSRAVGRAFCADSELSLGRSEGGISFGYCCHRKEVLRIGSR